MKYFFQLAFVFSALFTIQACNSASPKKTEVLANNTEKAVADRVLTAEIEGMVCEKGCGSSIRKELKATGAVTTCSFDFVEDRAKNVATIEYDGDKISEQEIVKIINSMNEKQFTVGKANSEQLASNVNVVESNSTGKSSSETPEIEMKQTRFQLPNLLELFSGLLRN